MSVDKLIKALEDEADHYGHSTDEVLVTPNPLKIREIAAELKKLREERDKLVECVKEIRDFKASPLRSETEHIWEICDQTLKDIGEL